MPERISVHAYRRRLIGQLADHAVQALYHLFFGLIHAAASAADEKIPVQISGIGAGALDEALLGKLPVGNGGGPHIGSWKPAQQGELAAPVIDRDTAPGITAGGRNSLSFKGEGRILGIPLEDFNGII